MIPPLGSEDPVDSLQRFVDHLEATAEHTIARYSADAREAEIAGWAANEIRAYREPMFMALNSIDDIQVRELAADCLWHIVAAAHFIGAARGAVDTGDVRALDDNLITMLAQRRQAELARQKHAANTEERWARLRPAVLHAQAATKADQLVASRAFAESIADEVWAYLGSKEGASTSTIERVIASILKDGEDSQPQP